MQGDFEVELFERDMAVLLCVVFVDEFHGEDGRGRVGGNRFFDAGSGLDGIWIMLDGIRVDVPGVGAGADGLAHKAERDLDRQRRKLRVDRGHGDDALIQTL